MTNGFFAILSRMKLINRWGLMRNSTTENLCEHTLQVAYIAHALAALRNKNGGNVDTSKAVMFALYHDCSEIITGDLPTPIKYKNDEIKSAYKKIEVAANNHLLSMISEDIRGEFEEYFSKPEGDIKLIVKAADNLSAYIKCIEEKNAGNHDFDSAYESIKAKIEASPLPEVGEFVEKYLPSFVYTLDELEK